MPKKIKNEPIVEIGVTEEHYNLLERIRGRKSQARMIGEIVDFYKKAKHLT